MTPSTTIALPHVHILADYEAAFNARRRELTITVHQATTIARASLALRVARAARTLLVNAGLLAAPAVTLPGWPPANGWRQQRDGRNRFLSQRWTRNAETFLAPDLAFFRSPVSEVL